MAAGPAVALVFASTVAAVWIGAALMTARHGFDITDEGFYLLSYRWWDVHHRNFTGAQYLYGPVFQLLDHNIAWLRIFHLITVVGSHCLFGWSFMRWLRLRRPAAPPTALWEAAGTATIVAAGGVVYGWRPYTPGYNDVVLLGALVAMALVFWMASAVERGVRVPARLFVGCGAVAFAIVLAKWAALPIVLLVAIAAAVALAPLGLRGIGRAAGCALAAMLATAGLVHLFVVPLTTAVPGILAVNRLLTTESMSLPLLLERYWSTSVPVFEATGRHYGLLVVAGAAAVLTRRPLPRAVAAALGVVGTSLAVRHALWSGGLGGGTKNVIKYVVPLLSVVAFVVATAVAVVLLDRLRRGGGVRSSLAQERLRGWVLLGVLVFLPVAFALGTGNAPLKVAVDAFAVSIAVAVALMTGMEAAPAAARWLTAAIMAAALVAVASIAAGGLWRHPYRGAPRAKTTTAVPGIAPLASIKLTPRTAQSYEDLRRRLGPYLAPEGEGRAMMAFDKMAGIVLMLGGRPVGEVWYASTDRSRTLAGIEAECGTGRPSWWGAHSPILLFNRPVEPADVDALTRCGLSFSTDYRLLAQASETMNLEVYVPVAVATPAE